MKYFRKDYKVAIPRLMLSFKYSGSILSRLDKKRPSSRLVNSFRRGLIYAMLRSYVTKSIYSSILWRLWLPAGQSLHRLWFSILSLVLLITSCICWGWGAWFGGLWGVWFSCWREGNLLTVLTDKLGIKQAIFSDFLI